MSLQLAATEKVESIRHSGMLSVMVAVCTYKRPKMLEICLSSLLGQVLPDNALMQVVVIDNDGHASGFPPYTRVMNSSGIMGAYLIEPKRGIASARNRAIEFALDKGAEYLCFIDDDEVADSYWLSGLMSPEWLPYPVLMGSNIYKYPEPKPFWAIDKGPPDDGDEGLACKTASSGNIRFSLALAHAGLRFDEKLNFSGGEDNDFFSRAYEAGFQIRRNYKAITYELVHNERLTYSAQMYRAYWCAASDMRRLATHKGWSQAIMRKLPSIPANIIFGVLWLALSILPLFIDDQRAFKKRALRGGKKIAKSIGRTVAMLGIMPAPYARTVGE